MKFVRMIKLKPLIVSLLIPLGLGGAVGMVLALTGQFSDYRELFQPPLSPSPWVFFVAWVILYTLMGISSYFVLTADKPVGARSDALWLYFVQLGVNLIWPILFFYFDMRLAAFLWIIVLIALVIKMIVSFWFISKPAALLQIPYILWLLFAAYLNGATYILNG
jgi:Tryptophan-rich sensory protein (mitochondrial benzodiazepine receptor homolog)